MRPRHRSLAVLLAAVALALAGCSSHTRGGRAVPAATPGPPRTVGSAGPASPGVGRVVRTVVARNAPDGATFGDGSVWVASYSSNSVTRLDPGTGRILATIDVGAAPITVAVDVAGVWVAGLKDGTVTRIDPATNRVAATVSVGGQPCGLVSVGGRLWVFDQGDGKTAVIDERPGRIVAKVSVGALSGWAGSLAGRAWVPDLQGPSGAVLGVDLTTHRVVRRVLVGQAPSMVRFGLGSGWIAVSGADDVVRFDPATGRVLARIPVPGGTPTPLRWSAATSG